ncbi:MAG: 4-alpha-glucanotransferase [Rectinemataceae bacterium]|jgi:4-alpha-glucanotransferase
MRMNRVSGILLHPTSLPGPFGIGDMGSAALNFIERMAEAGQRLWQVLPLGPTGYGDSPYAPFSSFAGNELLISPELLMEEGLMDHEELRDPPGFPRDRVDYGSVIPWKRRLLDNAAAVFISGASPERRKDFALFQSGEESWLPRYSLFRAIKDEYDVKARAEGRDGALWNNYWPKSLAISDPAALAAECERRAAAVERYEVLQFLFSEQWAALKEAANAERIMVVGDIPIFVAQDSADVWAERGLFSLDAAGRPIEVAGVPPDYFSDDGQLWGNPLYDWDKHRAQGFAWWIRRLRAALERFDVLRVDHFRGLEACWAVPVGEKTARRGAWKKAPGVELFAAVKAALGEEMPIIAEDLGFITDEVKALRDGLGFPGMRILQFAFDASESGTAFDPKNAFLPHNYTERCVAYTGTHDNDTLAGWIAQADAAERDYVERYLGFAPVDPAQALLRELMKSTAAWAVFPLQDILGLGSEARMNMPSTLGGNWAWRMAENAFSRKIASSLAEMSRLYGRNLD